MYCVLYYVIIFLYDKTPPFFFFANSTVLHCDLRELYNEILKQDQLLATCLTLFSKTGMHKSTCPFVSLVTNLEPTDWFLIKLGMNCVPLNVTVSLHFFKFSVIMNTNMTAVRTSALGPTLVTSASQVRT